MKPAALLLASLLLAACNECGPQDHRGCACPSGARGEQFCTAEGAFGACVCNQPPRDGGAGDAAVSADR